MDENAEQNLVQKSGYLNKSSVCGMEIKTMDTKMTDITAKEAVDSKAQPSIKNTTRTRSRLTDLVYTLLSIGIGIGLFFLFKPTLIKVFAEELVDVPVNLTYTVETRITKNGFSQVYLINNNGKVKQLTDEKFTHASPQTDDTYVVWMAQPQSTWQIYLYNIKTKKTIQLTQSDNNVNPKISNGKIVWERFVDGIWQIFCFDGMRITQITKDGSSKQNVDIQNDLIVFSEVTKNGWKIKLYNLKSKNEKVINKNNPGGNPKFSDDVLTWEGFDGFTSYKYDITSGKTTKNITNKPNKSSPLVNSLPTQNTDDTSGNVAGTAEENLDEFSKSDEDTSTLNTDTETDLNNSKNYSSDTIDGNGQNKDKVELELGTDTDDIVIQTNGNGDQITNQDILDELNINGETIKESTASTK